MLCFHIVGVASKCELWVQVPIQPDLDQVPKRQWSLLPAGEISPHPPGFHNKVGPLVGGIGVSLFWRICSHITRSMERSIVTVRVHETTREGQPRLRRHGILGMDVEEIIPERQGVPIAPFLVLIPAEREA